MVGSPPPPPAPPLVPTTPAATAPVVPAPTRPQAPPHAAPVGGWAAGLRGSGASWCPGPAAPPPVPSRPPSDGAPSSPLSRPALQPLPCPPPPPAHVYLPVPMSACCVFASSLGAPTVIPHYYRHASPQPCRAAPPIPEVPIAPRPSPHLARGSALSEWTVTSLNTLSLGPRAPASPSLAQCPRLPYPPEAETTSAPTASQSRLTSSCSPCHVSCPREVHEASSSH